MDEIRVGDAERSEALDRLGTLFADGYLEVSEFDERTAQAAVARTRGELATLFDDLPDQPAAPAKPSVSEIELEQKLAAKKKMDAAMTATGVLGFITFFVDLDYAWVVWPVMGALMIAWYAIFDISEEEDEVLEELLEKDKKERAERLKLAYERRKELGK
ncbi:DUF1707 domain-containing protein [uncultured Corynebacterium sp.]|uniref:DUF1707 SHOCT-like domain-containing protein n=1 Tax=uncultured Corynebacterium sp. TaxID=159447 RepID=UPI002597AA0F|nr:DUF1707 domain-containing protein [uncultured Corynebacterium sp.]